MPAQEKKYPLIHNYFLDQVFWHKTSKQEPFFLKLNLKSCPSNLLIAAEIKIFLFFLHSSFIKYRVSKLSVPSQIIS